LTEISSSWLFSSISIAQWRVKCWLQECLWCLH